MRRTILLLTIVGLLATFVAAPAQAQDACRDYEGWQGCIDLNACHTWGSIVRQLECMKRCHYFYCL